MTDPVDALVRNWVRLYTLGLDPESRTRRRDEIDSDLWEHRNGARSGVNVPLSVLGRWAAGIVDDLTWRAFGRRHANTKETEVTNRFGGSWWQALAGITAASTTYFGVRQLVSSEVSIGMTPGKIGALIVSLGAAAIIVIGLLLYRSGARRGAAMVLIGVLPVALIGGFGLFVVAGVFFSLVGGEGWWWLPAGIASVIATIAGFGAFSTWWNAAPSARDPRIDVLPASLVMTGLVVAGTALGLGLTPAGLAVGALFSLVGLLIFRRHLKTSH